MGPKEIAVRATLPDRAAAVLYERTDLGRKVRRCFAGLFNGARQGWLQPNGGLFLGKAECEWDWQEVWPALKEKGLVDYEIVKDTSPTTGHVTERFQWNITPKGHEVRRDDTGYFAKLMEAIYEDDRSLSNGPREGAT